MTLNEIQLQVMRLPLTGKVFLEGPAGAGKTSAAARRLAYMLHEGVPGESILVLVPQRTLAGPYLEALSQVYAGGVPAVVTMGGLARRMIDLFWPVIAAEAGFSHPELPPNFLTLETAQYFMAHLLRPKLDEGWFNSVRIPPNRLYSQVLDNLNKSALVGFPLSEIGKRLSTAWVGDQEQSHIIRDVQASVKLFRSYCLEHNLLDFSLQMEIFSQKLWRHELCRSYLTSQYRHFLYDNPEEDTPVAHDLMIDWLPEFSSSLVIYDWHAGFRSFLAADPLSAYRLKDMSQAHIQMRTTLVPAAGILEVGSMLVSALTPASDNQTETSLSDFNDENLPDKRESLAASLKFSYHRYFPQMLDWVAEQCEHLVHQEHIPPQDIVILSPFLPDAMRFSLVNRLENLNVPVRSHRPSHSLRDEPATRCLLTLTSLAYPEWGIETQQSDLAYALVQAIEGMDLVRARLLSEIVLRKQKNQVVLSSFDVIHPEKQARITYRLGERFEKLRIWLEQAAQDSQELDFFLSRLFGEVLSQPGYGFHNHFDAAQVTANLIESVQKFRWVVGPVFLDERRPLGQEYLQMVQQGVIAAQYLTAWEAEERPAVLIAPAYTFLMSNRPASVQFWLDIGSSGWMERLYQPLTHPYVLARDWPAGQQWTDQDEIQHNRASLFRLTVGLLRRCSHQVYLGMSELGEQGFEQRGEFLRAFQRALQKLGVEEA